MSKRYTIPEEARLFLPPCANAAEPAWAAWQDSAPTPPSSVVVGLGLAFGLATVLVASQLTALSGKECRTSPLRPVMGERTEATMQIRGGIPCPIRVLFSRASIEELTIDVPPEVGAAASRGRTGVIYRPPPDFKGDDAFEFTMRGLADGRRGAATVRVRVAVQ